MQLFNLHRRSVRIDYRNRLCSCSTAAIVGLGLLTLVLPYYVVQFVNPGDVWDRFRLAYEQPQIKFAYRYLFLAEVERPDEAPGGDEIVTCSSFDAFNELTEERPSCSAIKVIADDSDMDNKVDKLSVSVSFNLPEESLGIRFYTFYFFLEAEIRSRCHFTVPAFISLDKMPPPLHPFTSGTITHYGQMRSRQTVALQCPFFMRAIKSHFNHNYYPNENFTSVDQFLPESILAEIESTNAAHFSMEPRRTIWERDGSREVTIQVELLVGGEDSLHTALLYNTSIWQKLCQFWVQYFSVLIVFLWVADRLKDWLFEAFMIRAMEVVPWKQKDR